MGWQIMGTEHHTSEAEIAERTIDFIENLGMALLPWQAEALRAMLTYPVSAPFYATSPRQRPGKCHTFHLTVDDIRECPEHGQGH
jgi:hypothetical protein